MTQHADGDPQPVLAQTIHSAVLTSWLVRTAGPALVILVGVPTIGALLAALTGEPGLLGLAGNVGDDARNGESDR